MGLYLSRSAGTSSKVIKTPAPQPRAPVAPLGSSGRIGYTLPATIHHDPPATETREAPRRFPIAIFLAHVIAPLAAGVLIYILFRAPNIRLFDWLTAAGLAGAVDAARRAAAGLSLPRPLLYTLPDALWAYAFGAALGLIWIGGASRPRALWIAAALLIACAIELGQAASIIPGTFDWLDLLAIAAGLAAGALWAPLRARGKPNTAPTKEAG
jgi:hypothetical protein